jgi:ABC-type spermidine/putrescine transport system permease subunit I
MARIAGHNPTGAADAGAAGQVRDATLPAPVARSIPARRPPRGRDPWLALTLPAIVFMLVALAYPVARILIRSVFDPGLTAVHYQEMVENQAYFRVLLTTFRIAIVVTLLSLLIGYPVAYVLTRLRGFWASLLVAGVILPLWTSELVRGFAWTVILGRQGPLNDLLIWLGLTEKPLPLLFNAVAVYIGTTHIMLPFMILPLYSVMQGIDRRLVQAAMGMGATPPTAFRLVFLPLSLPGVVSGCLLVFVLATGFYVIPSILGSEEQTMIAMLIDTEARRSLNWGFASALAVALLAATAVLLAVYDRVFGLDRLRVGGAR